jgi:hypothetical protein
MNLRVIKANMTELELYGTKILFSYNTPVARIDRGELAYKTEKKWSATTTRHINQWLAQNMFHTLSTREQEYFDNWLENVTFIKNVEGL